jgi:hypothetical protein
VAVVVRHPCPGSRTSDGVAGWFMNQMNRLRSQARQASAVPRRQTDSGRSVQLVQPLTRSTPSRRNTWPTVTTARRARLTVSPSYARLTSIGPCET